MRMQLIVIAGILALSTVVFTIILSVEVEVDTPSTMHQEVVP